MKVVINEWINGDWGGFALSDKALELYKKLANRDVKCYTEIERNDPYLVQVVETLGKQAGYYASLKIVEIPDGVDWHITDYDGIETIRENHRTWS